MNEFNFCPSCGGNDIVFLEQKKWKCNSCGFTLYNNVAAAVGLILHDGQGNVIFEKRAKEPRAGFLALPGGFVNPDERAEDAAVRECFEEIGMSIGTEGLRFVGTFPNTYVYKNITYKTCDMFFSAEIFGKNSTVNSLNTRDVRCDIQCNIRDDSNTNSIKNIRDLLDAAQIEKSEVADLLVKCVAKKSDIDALPVAFESARLALLSWRSTWHTHFTQ